MGIREYRDTDKDIHERIYRFVIHCFKDVVKKIPKTVENIPIIGQLSDSLTSMGANDQEADAAGSKKDFMAKFTIVRKETKETHYWLRIVRDLELVPRNVVEVYIKESDEILHVVSAIIRNVSRT